MEGGLGSQTPELAQGFYAIEDVRKKRVRKGHTEYLIKWRDWPERSNTWEPVENVQEYVDEFEKSLLLRKQKRKRKGRVASKSIHREGHKGNETNELGHEAPNDDDVGTIATQKTHENESASSIVTEVRETTSIDNLNSENGKKNVSDTRVSDKMVESHIPEVDFDESTTHDAPNDEDVGSIATQQTHENEIVSSIVTELSETTSIDSLNSENGKKKVSNTKLSDTMVESHIPEVDFDESTTHGNSSPSTGAESRKFGNVRSFPKESTVFEDAHNGDRSEPDNILITHENESVSSKVIELRDTTSIDSLNSENGNKKVSDTRLSDTMAESHIPEVDIDESTTHSNRLTGAKRRKLGIVKRFPNESTVLEDAQNGDKSEPDHHKAERLSNYPHSITHENESVSSKIIEIREGTSIDNLNSENGEKKVSDIRLSDNMVESHIDNLTSENGKKKVSDIRLSDNTVESHIPEVNFGKRTIRSNRLTGAKKRKSGIVKRFLMDSTVLEDAQNEDKSEPDQYKAGSLSNYTHSQTY